MTRDLRIDPIGEFHPLTAEDCERSVRDAFHRQAARRPDRPAVIAGGRRVSYGALADRARQVPTVEALAQALVCVAVERGGAGAGDLARDGSREG